MYQLAALSILSALAPSVSGWGDLGHQTVGLTAQAFLSSQTVTWAKSILGDNTTTYLGNVAVRLPKNIIMMEAIDTDNIQQTWADTFKYTSEGEFSQPYHFIDAKDSPPTTCDVDYDRDCGADGCSVSAIANYTTRVKDTSLAATDRKEALEFLVHFLGDITQPLHDENYKYGANDIDVTFDGVATNMHHIWDTNMPEKLRGGYGLDVAQSWANDLVNEIKTGDYASDRSSWISGISIDDAQGTAMAWASDANAFVCSAALKNGETAYDGMELNGTYYTTAQPIFSEQIAKGMSSSQ